MRSAMDADHQGAGAGLADLGLSIPSNLQGKRLNRAFRVCRMRLCRQCLQALFITTLRFAIFSVIFFAIFVNTAKSAQYAEMTGAYMPDDDGECSYSTMFDRTMPDRKVSGVCIPVVALFEEDLKELLPLAITELKNPEKLEELEKLERKRRQPIRAYKVEVDDFDDGIFKLVDGSILEKKDHSYVGYLSYHEDGILYKYLEQWKLCVDGDSYEVDVLKNEKRHYSRRSFRASVLEIEKMEECD